MDTQRKDLLFSIPEHDIVIPSYQSAQVLVEAVKIGVQQAGYFQRWSLMLSGFEDDPRDVWDISPVRKWNRLVFSQFPFFPMILTVDCCWAFLLGLLDSRKLGVGRMEIVYEGELSRLLKEIQIAGTYFLWGECRVKPETTALLLQKSVAELIGRLQSEN